MTESKKLAVLDALLEQDYSDAKWTKSEFSGNSPNDCLEAAHFPELGGWILRHSVLTHLVIPLTDDEYTAYTKGVQAGQPGLVPGV